MPSAGAMPACPAKRLLLARLRFPHQGGCHVESRFQDRVGGAARLACQRNTISLACRSAERPTRKRRSSSSRPRGDDGRCSLAQAVHAVITASDDPELLAKVNRFDIIAPDGQPVRWALNVLHRAGLRDRVRGSELMLRACGPRAGTGADLPLRQLAGGALAALSPV